MVCLKQIFAFPDIKEQSRVISRVNNGIPIGSLFIQYKVAIAFHIQAIKGSGESSIIWIGKYGDQYKIRYPEVTTIYEHNLVYDGVDAIS